MRSFRIPGTSEAPPIVVSVSAEHAGIANQTADLLREASLPLDAPDVIGEMAAAINRLEGQELDATERGISLLVQAGKLTPQQGLRMALMHRRGG